MKKKNKKLEAAIKEIRKALQTDPAYYYAWQSSIAMAYVDESEGHIGDSRSFDVVVPAVANQAAKNFLNQLIGPDEL